MTKAEHLLQKFLAGELTPQEQQEFEHLQRTSPTFAQEVAEYKQLLQLLENEAEHTHKEAAQAPVVRETYKKLALIIAAGAGTTAITSSLVSSGSSSFFSSVLSWVTGSILALTIGALTVWYAFIRPVTPSRLPAAASQDTVTFHTRMLPDTILLPSLQLPITETPPPPTPSQLPPSSPTPAATSPPPLPSPPQPDSQLLLTLAPPVDIPGERAIQRYYRSQLQKAAQRQDSLQYIDVALRLAASYILTRDYHPATELLQHLTGAFATTLRSSDRAHIQLLYAQIARRQGKFDTALRHLTQALALAHKPELRAKLLTEQAFIFYQKGKFSQALNAAQQALQLLSATDPVARQLQRLVQNLEQRQQ